MSDFRPEYEPWAFEATPKQLTRVAKAIRKAWEENSDVPFPLYDTEAEALAKAAIFAFHGKD